MLKPCHDSDLHLRSPLATKSTPIFVHSRAREGSQTSSEKHAIVKFAHHVV